MVAGTASEREAIAEAGLITADVECYRVGVGMVNEGFGSPADHRAEHFGGIDILPIYSVNWRRPSVGSSASQNWHHRQLAPPCRSASMPPRLDRDARADAHGRDQ